MNRQPFETKQSLKKTGEVIVLNSRVNDDSALREKFTSLPVAAYTAYQTVVVEKGDDSKYILGRYMMASRGEVDFFYLCPENKEKPEYIWWTQGYEDSNSLLLKDRFRLFDSFAHITQEMQLIYEHYQPHLHHVYQVMRSRDGSLELKKIDHL